MDDHLLANMLYEQAQICGIKTSRARCLRVIRAHPTITDEISLMLAITDLIQEAAVVSSPCVSGVQVKDWFGNTLVKWDNFSGHPSGLVEHVVSRALDYVTLNGAKVSHVHYDAISDGRRLGCKCQNYRKDGDNDLEFAYYKEAYSLNTLIHSERFAPHLHTIALWFLLDAMFYNEDRHLGNLLFVRHPDGTLEIPPIFDMGNALMFWESPNYRRYEPNPFLIEQVHWARSVVGDKALQFDVMSFYNNLDRSLPYPSEKVSAIAERVLRCAEDCFIQGFVEVI